MNLSCHYGDGQVPKDTFTSFPSCCLLFYKQNDDIVAFNVPMGYQMNPDHWVCSD